MIVLLTHILTTLGSSLTSRQSPPGQGFEGVTMSVDALLLTLTEHRAAFAAARSLYARRLAPDFNVFDFINPDELRLSEILAWLLDPSGTHGQGALFLAEFLRELGLSWEDEDLCSARVKVEVEIDKGRRIDLLVRLPGAVLTVENKPFAADQPRQVADYLVWLDAQAPQGRRCLLYLAGADGALPSEASIAEVERLLRHDAGELQILSYGQLLPWLARARGFCQADTVGAFLDALARYIQKQFQGVRDMTERQQLVAVVRRSPENLRSAIQLLAAANDIRDSLLAELNKQLRAKLPADFSLVRANASAARYTGFYIALPGLTDVLFTVEFQAGDFRWLMYGMRRERLDVAAPGMDKALKNAFGAGINNQWWPWCRAAEPGERLLPVEGDWRASEKPWLDIESEALANRIVTAAKAFQAVLAPPAAT
ncbi:PAS domain-containing protein [Methylobacterium sp. OAE515]|uniref:PDDEXK-like family protein n=1 Tax=Methylobacterium sp. OAE515 TaxID=2817895 RepID=UPI001789FEF0